MESGGKKNLIKKVRIMERTRAIYSSLEKIQPRESAVEAFRRKPYCLGKR